MKTHHTLGSAIIEARILEGISVEELSEKSGIPTDTIRAIETGQTHAINIGMRLLECLEYGVTYQIVKK